MAWFLVKAILAPSGDQAGSESVAEPLVREVRPVPLDLMMSMCPSKPANAITSACTQATSKATDVETLVAILTARGLVPLTVQFVVTPERVTLWSPALRQETVTAQYTAKACPTPLSTLRL